MEPYGVDAGVVEEYRASIHGRGLLEEGLTSSPACTDCHGAHGAAPPRVAEVGRVCGHCHTTVQGFFEESPHLEPARQGQIEECVSCHGAHTITGTSLASLVGEGPSNCWTCHGDEEEPARELGARIYGDLNAFSARIEGVEADVRRAGEGGLFIEREHSYLDDARSLRGRARAMTHALSPERLEDLLSRGDAMIDRTYESLGVKQRVFRDRKIFTAIFLGVTLLLGGVLQVYRKEILVGRGGVGAAKRSAGEARSEGSRK
jgi:predicted CXXCH cytochrome family protein